MCHPQRMSLCKVSNCKTVQPGQSISIRLLVYKRVQNAVSPKETRTQLFCHNATSESSGTHTSNWTAKYIYFTDSRDNILDLLWPIAILRTSERRCCWTVLFTRSTSTHKVTRRNLYMRTSYELRPYGCCGRLHLYINLRKVPPSIQSHGGLSA